ncbi:major facilitator superfamily domain-containing protein [Copromyces sp. CBS 386.78]|nr:major facilitator superfamily domain-containing protein [Copromyces sp. CBS 386.78]
MSNPHLHSTAPRQSIALTDKHPSSPPSTGLDTGNNTEKDANPNPYPITSSNSDSDPDAHLNDISPAPDGGPRAWLVAAASAFIFFCALGYSNAFGVYEQYHLLSPHSPLSSSHTHTASMSSSKIAWIGSLQSFLSFFTGLFAGPLFDRYGASATVRPGAVLMIFAVMMTSLCKTYWQLMLAQGVLNGVAMGLLMFPAMAAVAQWFEKRRAAALGLAVSGSSVGGVVVPIVLGRLLNGGGGGSGHVGDYGHGGKLGFGWSVRVIGFVMLPLLGFASLAIKPRLPPRTTSFFLAKALKQNDFVMLVVAIFFLFLGMLTPLFFIPTYAVSRGVDATLARYLLAIVNAASTFGRIIPGVMADRVGKLNVLAVGGVASGIIILCFNKAETTAGLIVYSVVYGFSSGMIISGASAALTVCPRDPRDLGTYIGMGMALGSIAVLIGPPINGKLIDVYGGYSELSIFSGVMCLVGGLVTVASKMATPQGILGRV